MFVNSFLFFGWAFSRVGFLKSWKNKFLFVFLEWIFAEIARLYIKF
jgi:hypothetical protein